MRREFRIYRPNNAGNGFASKFQMVVKEKEKFDEPMVFWEMAEQTGKDENGNASFDWSSPKKQSNRSVTIKLGITDVGEILCVLCGVKEFVGQKKEQGLFHKNQLGNTVLKMTRMDKGLFYAALSSKKSGEVIQVKHSISLAEGIVLEQLLKEFVSIYYNWKEKNIKKKD
jgi:hypothetical protein